MNGLNGFRRGKAIAAIALAGAAAVVLAGCSGSSNPSDTNSGNKGPATELTLKMGSLLPQTGSLAFLGPPMEAGVGLAVKEVNDAKAGITIDYTSADEGDTDTKAYETSVTKLRSAGITGMVGAAASGVTKLILDGNVAAGILTVSPSNTSPDFTDFPGKNGLFFRTAPSDLLQGETLGNLIAEDGHESLGIIYQNDPYGTGLADAIKTTFEGSGGKVVAEASFNVGDAQFDSQVSTIKAANPDAVAVVSFDQFKTIGPLLVNAGLKASSFYLVDGNTVDYSNKKDMPVSLEGAQGTRPGPALSDDFQQRLQTFWKGEGNSELKDFTYAAEAYDAVVLMALSALDAKSTVGKDMAAKMQEVSGGTGDGKECKSFSECAKILADGGTPAYVGYSGESKFDDKGDPHGAVIGIFKYNADNTYTRQN
ncbi:ABC transporter substrate-binding protein [Microbacterium luticocti]|uniref:ABC transporter substrate-binding protein n=1 Tax=Microbacterium luticocti TaxID=451764 RepID=UPI0004185483|nr:ABC transporter substrate-binding protein [Microbacterium luticocti]